MDVKINDKSVTLEKSLALRIITRNGGLAMYMLQSIFLNTEHKHM